MSPVAVNAQPVIRSPQKGSEGGQGNWIRSIPQDSQESQDTYSEQTNYSRIERHELPHRPAYVVQGSEHQQPQSATIGTSEDSELSTPSKSPVLQLPSDHVPEHHDADPNELVPVPALQYHHHSTKSDGAIGRPRNQRYTQQSSQAGIEAGQSINRHLTPTTLARNNGPRPISTYSDFGPGRQSPRHVTQSPSWAGRSSAMSGRSNDSRPLSYLDLNNVSYPQMPPAPLTLDNSQLRAVVGSHASLLSHQKTLEMYRQNIKKLNDPETQYAFAVFLVGAAQEMGEGSSIGHKKQKSRSEKGRDSPYAEGAPASKQDLLSEAKGILQKLSDKSYPFAQYYLADGYASGLFVKGGEADYTTAFPLFVSASKHGHAEAGYRAALCYEFGWGIRKDPMKALQFLRHSASKNHPGAMTRLGRACLSGDLGENKYREGIKWLKRGTESADVQYNAAPFYLATLYETGDGQDIFKDGAYAAQLYTQAADLGHAESAFRMGQAYEHGNLCCPRDPALSVHFYTGAAQRGHAMGMMSLCAWYMIGAEPVLEKDENEAYEWAREAAILGTFSLFAPHVLFPAFPSSQHNEQS
jgi:TPR repeat protein